MTPEKMVACTTLIKRIYGKVGSSSVENHKNLLAIVCNN